MLVGALSHSGKFRAVFCEQMTFGHLAGAVHGILAGWAAAAWCGGWTGWRPPLSRAPTGSTRSSRSSPSTTASTLRSARHTVLSARVSSRRRSSSSARVVADREGLLDARGAAVTGHVQREHL